MDETCELPECAGKRVLLLGSYAPSLVNFRGSLIAEMVSRGHQVIAAAPDIDPVTAEALRALGAEPRSLELSNASLNPLTLLPSYRQLRRLLRAERPDLIFSYTIKPVILGALAGRAEKVPQIVSLITGVGYAFTEGSGWKRRWARWGAHLLYKLALACSQVVLFQNHDDEALFQGIGLLPASVESGVVAGSGVDLVHFGIAPLPAGPAFLMIARLLLDKGIREFAAAAKRLRKEHPDVPIGLVGYLDASPVSIPPEELDQLTAAGVHFYGKLADVRPAIAACSVYVLPSYREGTPRSVLEAMAMGRAIITTDAPGCRETVADGVNGFLVPVQDADALYEAMKRFVDDPQLASRMGTESRRLAEQRYDVKKVSADILRRVGL